MKRLPLVVPLFAAALAAACGSDPPVVVRASLEPGGPVADLPVRLLPYDRTALLDSLAKASGRPEPTLPQEVIQRLRGDSLSAPARTGPDTTKADSAATAAAARIRAMTPAQLRAFADSVLRARRVWEDSAYARYDSAAFQRVQAAGRGELSDTTDAAGVARFSAGDGDWWVWARYTLRNEELDWVVPLKVVEGGDSMVVTLTRANAVSRPLF